MQNHTISLPMAILININIMMGSGIFLNTVLIAQNTGSIGFISYLIVGLMLLPLVFTMAKLIELYPQGFYEFASKELGTFSGFITTWGYVSAKLASATIMIHTCVLTLQQLVPCIAGIHPFIFDLLLIGVFLALNMLHIKTGSAIQALFTTFKAIPIFFVIFSGLFLIKGENLAAAHQIWSGIPLILPITIYGVMGFEAACSISSKIHNAKKNAPLVILVSYTINMILLMAYQFLFYGALGSTLANSFSYRQIFPSLVNLCTTNPLIAAKLGGLFNIAIASSILGGAYGIIFSNAWNLYTLASHKLIIFPTLLTKLNKHAIPYVCILVEGALCVIFLFVSQGTQIVLQQIGALGIVFTYTMSALALIAAKRRNVTISIPLWVPLLGLFNCLFLIGACINGLLKTGPTGLYGFFAVNAVGSLFYCMARHNESK